jgi:hypothetical protein
MQRIPQTQKDALYIYEVMKTDAKQNGHMFIPYMQQLRASRPLQQHKHWEKLSHRVLEDGWRVSMVEMFWE